MAERRRRVAAIGRLRTGEGELDAAGERGHADGWRFHGLPWVQD